MPARLGFVDADTNVRKRYVKTEPLLGGVALFLLLAGCFLVLRPFMAALMWAIILAYTLSPLQRIFTRWFRGARTLAACLVTLTVAVMFVGPVVLIGMSLAQDGKELGLATRDWFMKLPDKAPGWVSGVPVVGDELDGYWGTVADGRKRWLVQIDKQVKKSAVNKTDAAGDGGLENLDPAVAGNEPDATTEAIRGAGDDGEELSDLSQVVDSPQLVVLLGKFFSWARSGLVSSAKAVGQGVTQVLFSAFLAFFLLRDAPELSRRLAVSVERLAGDRGQRLIKVASATVRGVIFGILGTALAQALVAGLGFWIAGVPGAVLLAVLTFFFAVIPFGPPIIWIPASLWLYAEGKTGFAIFMLLWGGAVISSVDNFLRPYLISHGSNTPFVLIFFGVIGGAIAFGLVGIFLGPILLAVAFRLIAEWSLGADPLAVGQRTSGN